MYIQEKADLRLEEYDEPTVVIRGSIAQVKDAFLVVENELLCKLPSAKEAALILLASSYVFNKCHTGGFTNVFILLEYSIMGRPISLQRTKLLNFTAQLAYVNNQHDR